jgi:hypothetical protein
LAYYCDDHSRIPLRVLWQSLRNLNPLLWIPVFGVILYQRVSGNHPLARSGKMRPKALADVSQSDVPQNVLADLHPLIAACEAAGFRHLGYFTSQSRIGRDEIWSAELLHQTGYMAASAKWVRVHNVDVSVQEMSLMCGSLRTDGTVLATCNLKKQLLFQEMFLPKYRYLNLGPGVDPPEIIRRHAERVSIEPLLVRFDSSSWRRQLLTESQELFDYQLTRGFLRPLTDEEIAILTESQPVK